MTVEEVKSNDADVARQQDNDRYIQGNCAQENKAGWWFNRLDPLHMMVLHWNVCSPDIPALTRCHAANLNGQFYRNGMYKGKYDDGVVWGTWKGLWYSLRHTTMKVRPLVFLDVTGSGAGEN